MIRQNTGCLDNMIYPLLIEEKNKKVPINCTNKNILSVPHPWDRTGN